MTRSALKIYPQAILCCACLISSFAVVSQAAESAGTNQPGAPVKDSDAPILTTAEQIHLLTRTEAAVGHRALIRGVVTCALPWVQATVIQDATRGIYVDQLRPELGDPPRLGELVEIEGVVDPGDFAPQIHARRLTRLGLGELPAPIHPSWDQLLNGSLDTQFVEIQGVVTSAREDGITLLTRGGKIKVALVGILSGTNRAALNQYEGSLVRLRGCLFANWDSATHQVRVGEIRMISSVVTVEEPAPANVFAVPLKHVPDLLLFDPQASSLRRVKVSGQIVQEYDGEYYLMEETNGLRFVPKVAGNFELGDLVEVVGFPWLTGPSPVLREALARKIGVAPLPKAQPLDGDRLFRAEHDATRVRLEAVLLSMSADQRMVELQSGLRRFVARVGSDESASASGPRLAPEEKGRNLDVPVGSHLELTGVYAGQGGNRTTGAEVSSFELLLSSSNAIRVLARPPFWTLPRLLALLGALLGALVVAIVWIRLLRHQVQQRTAQLQQEMRDREQAEHQRGIAQERARIARDLHDDLGSSLTEITMLATAGPGVTLPKDEAIERMENIAGKSRALVYALDEIVWAVDPSRDKLASVAQYLASYAEEYLAGLNIACRVQIPNSFPEHGVSGEVRHNLFLAVKEALNNAVRHGAATEIGFRVRVMADRLFITITDNGSGFDTSGRSNGHGLLNLRTRLNQLQGHCELESTPGAGTTVSFQLPLPIPNKLP